MQQILQRNYKCPPHQLLQASAPGSWGFAVAEASDASRESQGTAGDNCPD